MSSAVIESIGVINGVVTPGAFVINDYLLEVSEIENGYILTITKGSEVQEIYFRTLSELELETIRLAEEGRISAETARVVAETARVSAELSRETSEDGRESAESARVSAEALRVSAEQSRVSAETTRRNYEDARGVAEAARRVAESNRVSQEDERDEAERWRAYAFSLLGITMQPISGGVKVTITNKDGVQTSYNIMDGGKGDKGDDGVSPVTAITTVSGGHKLTIFDADHPSGYDTIILDGEKGDKGDPGTTDWNDLSNKPILDNLPLGTL